MNHVWQRAAGLALAVLLLAGCGRQPFVPDVPDDYRPVAVRDVEHFPQDLRIYTNYVSLCNTVLSR